MVQDEDGVPAVRMRCQHRVGPLATIVTMAIAQHRCCCVRKPTRGSVHGVEVRPWIVAVLLAVGEGRRRLACDADAELQLYGVAVGAERTDREVQGGAERGGLRVGDVGRQALTVLRALKQQWLPGDLADLRKGNQTGVDVVVELRTLGGGLGFARRQLRNQADGGRFDLLYGGYDSHGSCGDRGRCGTLRQEGADQGSSSHAGAQHAKPIR